MKGSYLGIDIAIKEIEPSQKYHVSHCFSPSPIVPFRGFGVIQRTIAASELMIGHEVL